MKVVQIYDFETKKVSSILAEELAPGMVEAEVEGVGRVWINSQQVKTEPKYKHPPFDEGSRDLLRQLKRALDEVFPKTLEEWEDGFRKDTHIEKELGIWSNIAAAYSALGATAPEEQRKEIFDLILACATNPREHVFKVVQLKHLSVDEACALMDKVYSDKSL